MQRVTGPTRLLCVAELAELLQVPVATIYRWRHKREGPAAIRIGRYVRFDPADVSRWLDERKSASSTR
ncbi:MAG: helix-turn-helix domain-containing protein [Actinomycetota bacterium]